MLESRILGHNPAATPQDTLQDTWAGLPSWVQPQAPATLFTPSMPKPLRGILTTNASGQWHFAPGRGDSRHPIPLDNLQQHILHWIRSGQITRGHPPFHRIYDIHRRLHFTETVARHVSAANLQKIDAPTLLQMHTLSPSDKQTWKGGYDEEYYGLKNLPAWITISQAEYDRIRPIVGSALPTMAISTIKYDENGNPSRAKWRIVALGNLDPHTWSSSDCFAPVISQVELRFLVSLAIHHRRPLRSGDVKQAFCQATLPADEQYVLRPPVGCPNTPRNTFWLLQRTLYGLKRSPKHWYVKMTAFLAQCGLFPTPNNPCMFRSRGPEPPLYLGLYVDDFVYFSPCRERELVFEK